MTTTKILYSKTFPHPANGQWEKVALEAEITPDEDVRSCLYALKKEVEQFHYQSIAHDAKVAAEQKTPEPQQSQEEGLAEAIAGCTNMKFLKIYESAALKFPVVKEAYDKKFAELNPVS